VRWLLLAVVLLWNLPQGSTEYVLVKPGAKEYHRPGCEVVRDAKDVVAMTRAEAELRGLRPHAACDPAKNPSARDGAPAVQYVFVEPGDKRYHREKCSKLGPNRERITLDEAAKKKYWPCPACKPPIRKRVS
jgi:hypothetical protein